MTDLETTSRSDRAPLFAAMPPDVSIFEVGPRDGLQNESTILSADRKIELVEGLVDAGVRRIELTSFVNPRWIPALADHMEVATRVRRKPGVAYSALVPNLRGLDSATRAGMQEIAVFMAASQTHNRKNINKTTEDALTTYREVIKEALARNMQVRGYVSTVYGCPYEGPIPLDQVLRVADSLLNMGVYEISLGDTIGVGTPRQVEYILDGLLRAGVRLDQLAVHFHDTRGTALANMLVGLELGVRTFDASVGGLGGCPYAPGAAGNLATEDLVYTLHGMGIGTGIDPEKLLEAGRVAAAVVGRELPGKVHKAGFRSLRQ